MKTSVVLSALLSFGILGLAAGFIAGKFTQDARAATGGASSSDLAAIEERLAALEKGLDALGQLRSEVDALKRQTQSPSDPVAPPVASEAPVEEAAAALVRAEGDVAPTKLEKWLEGQGMRGEFEDLVSKVYTQARTARMTREREEQEERAREMEALSQGPYGKFNYRVNSLSKKLVLDTRQEEYVYNLLLKYDERRRQEMEQLGQLKGGDVSQEQVKEHMDQTMRVIQDLNQQYESDLLAGLNPKQREAYESLPEHERSGEWGDAVKMISFEGATGVVGTSAVRFSIPLERPVQVPKVPAPTPPPTGGK
jgi:hypothetical protein